MIKKITKKEEFNQFSKIAKEWWLPNGKFQILHRILPVRIAYILENIKFKNLNTLKVLDLGCGGGLTCEPLARLGADVTGLDFIKENIKIAKNHSKISNLKINYINEDIDSFNIKKKYDVILLLEVLEHIDDWKGLITKCKNNLKPEGRIILSTFNKTYFSKFFGIFVAENILEWVPKKTHDYEKFIRISDLKKELIYNNFKIINVEGMNYNPLFREWKLSKTQMSINYFCTAQLI